MSDEASLHSNGLTIPPAVQEQFGSVIELIIASESMNQDERQYWVNILPIMTADQLQNLTDILLNEKRQLAAIDAKYAKEVNELEKTHTISRLAHERSDRRSNLEQAEQKDAALEEEIEEDILDKINSL